MLGGVLFSCSPSRYFAKCSDCYKVNPNIDGNYKPKHNGLFLDNILEDIWSNLQVIWNYLHGFWDLSFILDILVTKQIPAMTLIKAPIEESIQNKTGFHKKKSFDMV